MNKKILAVSIIILVGAWFFIFKKPADKNEQKTKEQLRQISSEDIMKGMKIASSQFNNNGNIPSRYTCDGDDISPPLNVSEIPQGTKSLVLIVDDPDAPSGDWVHWVVWNIPPDIRKIEENSIPQGGIEGVTDFGSAGYGGPCPPSGTHRYQFKLYALDNTLDLDISAEKKDVEAAMQGRILDQTTLVGLYSRQ